MNVLQHNNITWCQNMDKLMPPDMLNLEGNNLTDMCEKLNQYFKVFSVVCGLSEWEEKVQAATLLHVAGPEALDIYNTFTWGAKGNNKKVSKIFEKLEAYCMYSP